MSRDRDDLATPPEATKWGLPLTYAGLHHPLTPVTRSSQSYHDIPVPHAKGRLFSAAKAELQDTWGGYEKEFRWDQNWRDISFEIMAKAFTLDELFRLWMNSSIMSEVSQEFEYNPLYQVFHHLSISSFNSAGWVKDKKERTNTFIKLYQGLSKFSFGIEGFTAYLTYTRGTNATGPAVHGRPTHDGAPNHAPYLDGVLGYNIVHKAERVATIGFNLSAAGVFLCQVQLAQKNGNRWLFKLPKTIIEHVVDCLARCWPDLPVWIIEGESAVKQIQTNYGKKMEKYPPEHWERIARWYNVEMKGYKRGEELEYRRRFFKLIPTG